MFQYFLELPTNRPNADHLTPYLLQKYCKRIKKIKESFYGNMILSIPVSGLLAFFENSFTDLFENINNKMENSKWKSEMKFK